MHTSKLVNPFMQDPSIDKGGLKRNVSHGLVNLNSSVSCVFV